MLRMLPLAALIALLLLPASAMAAPAGIGFVQAEEGTWFCRAGEPADAFNCARKKCVAEGNGQECHATRWCFPSGWSGVMVVWLSEFHSTVPICGAPTAESAKEALKSLCAGFDDGHRCDLIRMIDPEGKSEEVEGVVWPGKVMVPDENAEPVPEEAPAKP